MWNAPCENSGLPTKKPDACLSFTKTDCWATLTWSSSLADPIRIVLVSPRNPLNIGAAARAMSNFGFADLRLVNAYDLAFREAKSAVKSRYILEQAETYSSLAEAVAECSLVVGTTAVGHRDLHVPLYRLETG